MCTLKTFEYCSQISREVIVTNVCNYSLDCPILGDTVDGGHASLNKLTLYDKTTFRYDCIWQLRLPTGSSKHLKVFVRITALELMDGKLIQIKLDTFSATTFDKITLF